MPKFTPVIFIALLFFTTITKAQTIEALDGGKPTSIRGLSVVDDKTAWVSGSKGHVARTTDGGQTWQWQQVKGYEQADFRDIEAFNDQEAIIMSSGTPALILKTTDGGGTWQLQYKNEDKAYFLDAMDFTDNKHGFILGDPINQKFLLLETTDAGETWHPFINQPNAADGEAAFAASGTCLRTDKNTIGFVTGGKVARHIAFNLRTQKWNYTALPIKSGKDSQGIFSFNEPGFIYVGGDYANPKATDSTAVWFDTSFTKGKNGWAVSEKNPGYQSCVEYIFDGTNLSTGTSGTNISTDGGQTWRQIDAESYNVCRHAKHGKLVLLAGDKGKIGKLKI